MLRRGSIATLYNDDSIPAHFFKQFIPDADGERVETDCELKQFVSPKAVGNGGITDTFGLTYALLAEWRVRAKEYQDDEGIILARDDNYDPVPVIINFSNANVKITNKVIALAQKIMNIELADGKPLIINNIYDKKPLVTDNPSMSEIVDIQYKDFCKISSTVPNEMLYQMTDCGLSYVKTGSKFLFLNPDYRTLLRLTNALLWTDDSGHTDDYYNWLENNWLMV